jgi:hypothetical protein
MHDGGSQEAFRENRALTKLRICAKLKKIEKAGSPYVKQEKKHSFHTDRRPGPLGHALRRKR